LAKKDVVPVHGKVLFNGEPVNYVLLELHPTDPAKGVVASGIVGADGEFTLRTYSNAEPDGAVPGEYKVSLENWDAVRAGGLPEGATPTKVTPEMNSGKTVEIKGEEGNLTISLP
jgi:hypothetical protein